MRNVKWRARKFPFLGEEKEDRYAAGTLGLNLKEGKLGFFYRGKSGENLSWEENQLKFFLG